MDVETAWFMAARGMFVFGESYLFNKYFDVILFLL